MADIYEDLPPTKSELEDNQAQVSGIKRKRKPRKNPTHRIAHTPTDSYKEVIERSIFADFMFPDGHGTPVLVLVHGKTRLAQAIPLLDRSEISYLPEIRRFVQQHKAEWIVTDLEFNNDAFKATVFAYGLRYSPVPKGHPNLNYAETTVKRIKGYYNAVMEQYTFLRFYKEEVWNHINFTLWHIPVKTGNKQYVVPFKEINGKLAEVEKFKPLGWTALLPKEKHNGRYLYLGTSPDDIFGAAKFIALEYFTQRTKVMVRHLVADSANWRPINAAEENSLNKAVNGALTEISQLHLEDTVTKIRQYSIRIIKEYQGEETVPYTSKVADIKYGHQFTGTNDETRAFYSKALRKEVDQIMEHNTLVPLSEKEIPVGAPRVGSMIIFNRKRSGLAKARWVALGNQVKELYTFRETYSPTSSDHAQKIVTQFAAQHDLKLHSCDFKCAYLNGKNSRELYIEIPVPLLVQGEGVEKPTWKNNKRSKQFAKLTGNLYGLSPAGKIWYDELHKGCVKLGFNSLITEPCIYMHCKRTICFCIYVDDCIIASSDEDYQWFLQGFKSIGLDVVATDMEDFLGTEIKACKEGGYIISQTKYLETILERFEYHRSKVPKKVSTPTSSNPISGPAEKAFKVTKESITKYRSMLNSAAYLRKTRYDILYALKCLSTQQNNPSPRAFEELDRLYRYLWHNSNWGIKIQKSSPMNITAYCDASANSTNYNTGGEVIFIGDNGFTASSKRQSLMTESSAYSETYEIARCTKYILAIRNILIESGLLSRNPKLIPVYTDNKAAIEASVKSSASQRTRHFEIQFHFYKQYIGKVITLEKVKSEDNPADIFTKSLDRMSFNKHRERLLFKIITEEKSKLEIVGAR